MSEENEDYTTNSIANVIENGSDEEIMMLLGGRERIRHAGIIRAGKKRPFAKCTAQEVALFEKLEAEGMTYDDIDRAMGGKPKSRGSKLTTTNTDYFVLRESDFKKPSDCAFILKTYADADGRVRRIPVFFTVADLDKAIPHSFTAFDGGGQLRCKSFYDKRRLKFKYVEKSVVVPKAEDWKILDTEDEDEATKACGYKVSFSGMYRVNVVGLRGIGEVIVPNKSWNGMGDAVSVLEKIQKRLGRFDGLLSGQSMFDLCKVCEYVKHEGKKVKQFVITLELSVDPMDIERHAEKLHERGPRSLAILNGEPLKAPASFEAPALPPAPDEPVEGTTDAPAVSPEITGAIAAIEKLTTAANIPVEHFEAFVSYSKGVALAELTIEELRKLYAAVKKSVANESAAEDFREHCEQCFEGGQSG